MRACVAIPGRGELFTQEGDHERRNAFWVFKEKPMAVSVKEFDERTGTLVAGVRPVRWEGNDPQSATGPALDGRVLAARWRALRRDSRASRGRA